MHFEDPTSTSSTDDSTPWYKLLDRYHWFVFLVSVLGWMFDCLDQQLFNLARGPAIRELHGPEDAAFWGGLATTIFILGWATGGIIFGIVGDRWGRAKTMVVTILMYSFFTGLSSLSQGFWDFAFYRFLTGLGVGGEFAVGVALVAEVMPEKARSHALGWLQACSAIGNITAAFISMGLAPMESAGLLGDYKPWRWMFIVGALPALLAVLVRRRLKEPEKWKAISEGRVPGQKLGSITELFGTPILRRNALIGLGLAVPGVVGLWAIGFFSFDLVRAVFRENFVAEVAVQETLFNDRDLVRFLLKDPNAKEKWDAEAPEKERLTLVKEKLKPLDLYAPDARVVYQAILTSVADKKELNAENVLARVPAFKTKFERDNGQVIEDEKIKAIFSGPAPQGSAVKTIETIVERTRAVEGRLTLWAGINGLLFNIGAFFGIYSFSKVTHLMGRKPAFAIAFVLALFTTAFAFWNLSTFSDVFWMVPLMGFSQISLFGGYAIYFPELFPTRLRSTGTSFCYNVGRFVAAPAPVFLGTLGSMVFGSHGDVMSWRLAGVTMCSFFLLGLLVLPFAPETKDKPLPE